MHQTLGPRNIPPYYKGMELETKQFIRSILSDPTNYMRHIRRYSGGLTLSVVYGYEVASSDDKYLLLAEECMNLLANEMASGPGLWPVDIFPILRYVPAWAPGGGFKRKAKIWKARMEEFFERPFVEAKGNMVRCRIFHGSRKRSKPNYMVISEIRDDPPIFFIVSPRERRST